MNSFELKSIDRARKMLAGGRSAQITAHNCFARYMQRPDTDTGRREHERFTHWTGYAETMFNDAEVTLTSLLDREAGSDTGR